MFPSGYPYRFEYFHAEVIAFMTESGGPQQFSLLDRCAKESQSSIPDAADRARAAAPGAFCCCAKRSTSGPTPRYPTAAATPPMNLRRETLMVPPCPGILARKRRLREPFQLVPGQAKDRPVVHGPCAKPLVKPYRRLVPIQDRPFQSPAPPLDG